jgi:hypothetical protein
VFCMGADCKHTCIFFCLESIIFVHMFVETYQPAFQTYLFYLAVEVVVLSCLCVSVLCNNFWTMCQIFKKRMNIIPFEATPPS